LRTSLRGSVLHRHAAAGAASIVAYVYVILCKNNGKCAVGHDTLPSVRISKTGRDCMMHAFTCARKAAATSIWIMCLFGTGSFEVKIESHIRSSHAKRLSLRHPASIADCTTIMAGHLTTWEKYVGKVLARRVLAASTDFLFLLLSPGRQL